MHSAAKPEAPWAQHLLHPVPLLAVLVLAVNDHVLKGSGLLPGLVTGKLSDIAGLFFFPILLSALAEGALRLVRRSAQPRTLAWISVALTGAIFSALKLHPPFNACVAHTWGANALDPTDLLCLPVLVPSWFFMRRARPFPGRQWLQLAAAGTAAFATMATSWFHAERVYPTWTAESIPRRELACASAVLWVAKSGKEGAGVVLELVAGPEGCSIRIEEAELRLPSKAVAAPSLPGPFDLRASASEHAWIAFPFDGDAAWNAGERKATLRLAIRSGSRTDQWAVELMSAIAGGQQIKVDQSRRREWRASP